ncbi:MULTISPECIES: MFS transporter [Arthrobacter]|uniref:MFS transporter n=1 Tax=Arthrobacter TaxID=1663 RepID=UPI00209ACA8D|nr:MULTISPECIES: MFS transporter [Arthrobacter]MDQ0211933.1 SET family sugar efflux transporter-like MFS transporter [Arthrobacter bambusae]MDQ0236499.1 SET family sugar efflux transporter-like MFS transporter [Arthrobacter bambusae]
MDNRNEGMKRLLVPSAALLWGFQFAFLNPALALLLVALFNATPAEVGWVLAVYNASGFVASLLVPAHADRANDYLRPMLACGVLTLALSALLAVSTSLPIAVVGLIVLGGPAGVGSSLLFAHLRHSGAGASDVMNTRAIVSFAWVAGPPLATLIMGALGNRAILLALGVVAVLNVATTAAMISRRRAASVEDRPKAHAEEDGQLFSKSGVAAVVFAFVALQATNSAAVSIMSLFVTQGLGVDVIWAGVALGVSAALEIPALFLIGRLARRYSSRALIASGCVAGIAYYAGMAFVSNPATLIALQVLNAWFFGIVAGVGLTLFQRLIPRPGLASGLYTNTRRVGAIVSGPIIALGSTTALGYQGVFAACAALTVLALLVIVLAGRPRPTPAKERPAAPAPALDASD